MEVETNSCHTGTPYTIPHCHTHTYSLSVRRAHMTEYIYLSSSIFAHQAHIIALVPITIPGLASGGAIILFI